jgi:acetoin utilization deacetylase AcuC-like enzyme
VEAYFAALGKALKRIEKFAPLFLVVSLGFDTMRGDPTGTFKLTARLMHEVATRIAQLRLPSLVVQEGGYNLRNLKRGCVQFFAGMADATAGQFPDERDKT